MTSVLSIVLWAVVVIVGMSGVIYVTDRYFQRKADREADIKHERQVRNLEKQIADLNRVISDRDRTHQWETQDLKEYKAAWTVLRTRCVRRAPRDCSALCEWVWWHTQPGNHASPFNDVEKVAGQWWRLSQNGRSLLNMLVEQRQEDEQRHLTVREMEELILMAKLAVGNES